MAFLGNFPWKGGMCWSGGNSKSASGPSQSYNDQVMTPWQLFDWACANIPAVHFEYCSSEDYTREQSTVVWSNACFALSCTIPGTRKLHSFVPLSDSTVQVKHYSTSDMPGL